MAQDLVDAIGDVAARSSITTDLQHRQLLRRRARRGREAAALSSAACSTYPRRRHHVHGMNMGTVRSTWRTRRLQLDRQPVLPSSTIAVEHAGVAVVGCSSCRRPRTWSPWSPLAVERPATISSNPAFRRCASVAVPRRSASRNMVQVARSWTGPWKRLLGGSSNAARSDAVRRGAVPPSCRGQLLWSWSACCPSMSLPRRCRRSRACAR